MALVKEALNKDVDFIDTADIYGLGRSEELISQVLKEYKRDECFSCYSGR
ncbi:aldo/keto reductase [Saccharibacillus kuerlensis]|nr:aldo/keto reductase [Saccharibacillus kuerlensis]